MYVRMHVYMHACTWWCIQKFPDWVITKLTTINTRWEATQRVMAAKLTRLAHKIAMQLNLVAESCINCSSRSRWPVRKLLDTPSYMKPVYYRARNSSLLVHFLRQMNPVHTLTKCPHYYPPDLSSVLFPAGVRTKILCAFLVSHAPTVSFPLVSAP